jgi:hypothetical protein
MQETDVAAAPRSAFDKVLLEVSVPRLYMSAIRVCARKNPNRHAPWLDRLAQIERAARTNRYSALSVTGLDSLRGQLRAYVTEHTDVADEVATLMDRLVGLLTMRGAQIVGRDPTTVRCTRWWQKCSDWMDGAVALDRPGAPHSLSGFVFGRDYAASIRVVHSGASGLSRP